MHPPYTRYVKQDEQSLKPKKEEKGGKNTALMYKKNDEPIDTMCLTQKRTGPTKSDLSQKEKKTKLN